MTEKAGETRELEGLRDTLELVATYLETQTLEHSPDCFYGATNGPHGDFCDCGLSARRHKRDEVYAKVRAALTRGEVGRK